MVSDAISKRVDTEFDKGIFHNKTLKPYDWKREDNGEWVKGPKVQGLKIYTLPSSIKVKRKKDLKKVYEESNESLLDRDEDKTEGGSTSTKNSNNDNDSADVNSMSKNQMLDGPISSWYKENGKWKQMQTDSLGYIDPKSNYGQIIEFHSQEKTNKQKTANN